MKVWYGAILIRQTFFFKLGLKFYLHLIPLRLGFSYLPLLLCNKTATTNCAYGMFFPNFPLKGTPISRAHIFLLRSRHVLNMSWAWSVLVLDDFCCFRERSWFYMIWSSCFPWPCHEWYTFFCQFFCLGHWVYFWIYRNLLTAQGTQAGPNAKKQNLA